MDITTLAANITSKDKSLVAGKLHCNVKYINMLLKNDRNNTSELSQGIFKALEIAAEHNIKKDHEIDLLARGL